MAFGQPNPAFLANMSGFLSGMGAQQPQMQPPIAQAAQPPVAPIAQAVQAQQHHGINWLGVLADALSGATGQPGMYAHEMMRQKEEERQLALQNSLDQSQSDRELNRQKDLYQFRLDHPEKKDPVGYAAELAAMGLTPGTPEFNQRMSAHLNAIDDPLVTTTLPGDRVYSGPRSGLAAALSGASGGSLPKVSDSAGYNALPPGAQFIDPQGNVRTKGGQSGAASTGGFRQGAHNRAE